MKRFLIVSLCMLNCVLAFGQASDSVYLFSYFKGNGEDGLHLAYSNDGLQWHPLRSDSSFLRPAAGQDKLMRDPCIIQGPDGTFHMVWTVSWNEKGIGYAYSHDLINWSEQRYLPVMEHEAGARNCWAPEVFYDPSSKLFLIYWATTITGRFPKTDSKKESGYNHRMYYVTTRDFSSFSKTKLLYEPGFNVIDGTIILHANKYVMFVKDETIEPPMKNIRMATSANLIGKYSAAGAPITGNYWAEGPTCIRVGNRWIVYFDKYRDHKMGAVASSDLSNWTDISNEVYFPDGVRHGSVFKVPLRMLKMLER